MSCPSGFTQMSTQQQQEIQSRIDQNDLFWVYLFIFNSRASNTNKKQTYDEFKSFEKNTPFCIQFIKCLPSCIMLASSQTSLKLRSCYFRQPCPQPIKCIYSTLLLEYKLMNSNDIKQNISRAYVILNYRVMIMKYSIANKYI